MRNFTAQTLTLLTSIGESDLFIGRLSLIEDAMASAMECRLSDVSHGISNFLVDPENYSAYHKGLTPSEEECLRDLCRFMHRIAEKPSIERSFVYVNLNTGVVVTLLHMVPNSLGGRMEDPLRAIAKAKTRRAKNRSKSNTSKTGVLK